MESPWTLFGPLFGAATQTSDSTGANAVGAQPIRAYHIGNATAGLFSDDLLDAHIHLLPHASVRLTSPSASYAYTMETGEAVQRTQVDIAGGASLDYSPKPLIPYAGSALTQTTSFSLPSTAGLRVLDTVVLGRLDYGEIADFRSLATSLSIEIDGETVVCDRLRMDVDRVGRDAIIRAWDGAGALGSLYAAGNNADLWQLERSRILDVTESCRKREVQIGVTRPNDTLVIARALGPYPQAVQNALEVLESVLIAS